MTFDQRQTRVALLVNEHHYHAKVVQLAHRLADEPVQILFDEARWVLPYRLAECDLILVEAFGPVTDEQQATLDQIRQSSRAPMVMLTTGERAERTIEGLLAGADAVISLTTALEVMVAHCRALLRRWQPRPYSAPGAPEFSQA